MPINLAALNEHADRVNEVHPDSINRRTMTTLVSTSLRYLQDIALAADPNQHTYEAGNEKELLLASVKQQGKPSLRQQRHSLVLRLSGLMHDLRHVGYSEPSSLSAAERAVLRDGHRTHQSVTRLITELGSHDIDPVNVVQWSETKAGRSALAGAVQEAQDKHGTKPSELARQQIRKETGIRFLEDYKRYLDQQFPGNQPDETRPTLTLRDTLIMGRQLADAMQAQENADQPRAMVPIAQQVCDMLVGGQNTFRYNLPLEEGIATHSWWEKAIESDFNLPDIAPSHVELTNTRLQDQLDPVSVLQFIKMNAGTSRLNPVDPTVTYLEDFNLDDQALLMSLDKNDNNQIAVIGNGRNEPVIVTKLIPSCPGYLMVTAPNKSYQIVHCPDATGDLTARANSRKATVLAAAETLKPHVAPKETEQHINDLHKRWRSLIDQHHYIGPQAVESRLKEIHLETKHLAESVDAPWLEKTPEHQKNAKSLVILAMLTAHDGSDRQAWTFRTPSGTATRSANQPPALVVGEQTLKPDGTVDMTLLRTDAHGHPTDESHTLSSVPQSALAQTVAAKIKELAPHSYDIGKPTNVFHGLVTHAANTRGDLISTGHWLSDAQHQALTQSTPLALTNKNPKTMAPLFLDGEYRTQSEVQDLKDAVAYLLHGDAASPEQLVWAAEMASYDGDYALIMDMEDFGGSPKVRVSPFLFETATTEDIRRHLVQQVILRREQEPRLEPIMAHVESTPFTKATQMMSAVFEEYDEPYDEMAPTL